MKAVFDETELVMIKEMMKTIIMFFPADTEICRHAKHIRKVIEKAEKRRT